ncbi:MAG: fatty acid desaturase family protein [Nocardioidaceae bacterium]
MTTTTAAAPPTDARPGPGSDFAELRRRITRAGLLQRRPAYYAVRLGLVAVALVGGWAAFVAVGDSWWQLGIAGVLAVAFAQVALIAHDLAHRQVFASRAVSERVGRVAGNLCIGMSYGWWMDKHTRHHANPNHEDLDPDVSPEILVWSEQQASARRTRLQKFLTRWQALLFLPLLTLEGLNLHVSSFRALSTPTLKHRWTEATLLVCHVVGYVSAVLLVLPPGKALAFMAVHQAIFGVYLGCTFAPNHKGMPTLTGADRPDYLRKQVLTSRNVTGGTAVDIALGGLNYQIEHHLFPSMPTPNLARARPIVKSYCAELGVDYCETSLVRSYADALRHMHRVGAPLRA